jgi:bifunctional DNase/RNase
MVQVTVAGLIRNLNESGCMLLLHIPPLNKYLPIWIGQSEGLSIQMALQKETFERPLTHDLLLTIIDGLEGKVSKVTVTDLRDNTFYAKVFIERGQQVFGIDARPSDSIAIAVRADAPIFVSDKVLEQEKENLVMLDEEATREYLQQAEGLTKPGGGGSEPGPISDEDPDDTQEGDDSV